MPPVPLSSMPTPPPNWGDLACGTDEEVRTCSKHLPDKLLNKLTADGYEQVVNRFVAARKENTQLNPGRAKPETVARVRKEFADAKRDAYKALAGQLSPTLQKADSDLQQAEQANENTGKHLRDLKHLALCLVDKCREAEKTQHRTRDYLKEGRRGVGSALGIVDDLRDDLRGAGQEEGDDGQEKPMPQPPAPAPAPASAPLTEQRPKKSRKWRLLPLRRSLRRRATRATMTRCPS